MPIKKTSSSIGPLLLISIGILLIVVVLLGQAIAANLPQKSSQLPQNNDNVTRTSLQDAKKAYDSKSAVFLDVRDVEFFAQSHIPGALNIPYGELNARLSELDPNQWIITYCT